MIPTPRHPSEGPGGPRPGGKARWAPRDFAALPYPALVYFAASCARRVEPLFSHFWSEASEDHRAAVRGAIEAAESFATLPPGEAPPRLLLEAREAARKAADAAVAADASGAPRAAVHAADAAAELGSAIDPMRDRRDAVRAARRIMSYAARSARHAASGLERTFHDAAIGDLELLHLHATTEGWNDAGGVAKVLRTPA